MDDEETLKAVKHTRLKRDTRRDLVLFILFSSNQTESLTFVMRPSAFSLSKYPFLFLVGRDRLLARNNSLCLRRQYFPQDKDS